MLLSVAMILVGVPTILLLLHLLDDSSGSSLQFISALGLTLFYPLSFFTLLALFLNLSCVILLSIGIQKDLPILTGSISFLTAIVQTLIMSAIITFPIVMATDDQAQLAITTVISFIVALAAANPSVFILAYFIIVVAVIIILAFLINGIRGFREAIVRTPLSTLFPSGVLIESARKDDAERLMEIYYAIQRSSGSVKNRYELWKTLMKNINLERDVRLARFDGNVVGFLITSQDFTQVKSVHLTSEAIADEAEKCLLHDFARLYSRSIQYVDFIEVSVSDEKLQRALLQNGWEIYEKLSWGKIVLHYTD